MFRNVPAPADLQMFRPILAEGADLAGTSMLKYLELDLFEKIQKNFTASIEDVIRFDYDGYDPANWTFVMHGCGPGRKIINVYARWGNPRIGGTANLDDNDLADFEDWIRSL